MYWYAMFVTDWWSLWRSIWNIQMEINTHNFGKTYLQKYFIGNSKCHLSISDQMRNPRKRIILKTNFLHFIDKSFTTKYCTNLFAAKLVTLFKHLETLNCSWSYFENQVTWIYPYNWVYRTIYLFYTKLECSSPIS